jgi:hypothetical protein
MQELYLFEKSKKYYERRIYNNSDGATFDDFRVRD